MSVKKNDGTPIAKVATADGIDKAVSGNAIIPSVVQAVTGTAVDTGVMTVVKSASDVHKWLGTGTYQYYFDLVRISDNQPDRAVGTLAVTDSQTAVTAQVLETTYKSVGGDIRDVFRTDKMVKFYYGDKVVANLVSVDSADYKVTNGEKNAYVKSVTVTVKVAASKSNMQVTVPVNKTFVTTGDKWN